MQIHAEPGVKSELSLSDSPTASAVLHGRSFRALKLQAARPGSILIP